MIFHLLAPLLAHHGAFPLQSRPISAEKTVFAENFGFFARFCRKKRVALPLNKVAAVHTCAQSDSRTRNFPYLCAVTQPPTAHFRPIPAENSAFAEIFFFFARFCRKKRVVLPLNKVAAVHTCAQSDSRTRNFPYLCAVTQPPTAHFHSIPARFPPKKTRRPALK